MPFCLAQVSVEEQCEQRTHKMCHQIPLRSKKRIQDRHAKEHRRQIPHGSVDSVREKAAHFHQRKLPEIISEGLQVIEYAVLPYHSDQDKADPPGNQKFRKEAPDFMQDEVKRLRADSVRLPADSGRLRTDSGRPGTNAFRLQAGSFRPPCHIHTTREQVSGTIFPPCHIHTAREQVSGTVFPSCLVCADKEQVSGDEKEKLDGQ